jgi:hypothetical protein
LERITSGYGGTAALYVIKIHNADNIINPLTPELNPSAQRYMTNSFTGDFAS